MFSVYISIASLSGWTLNRVRRTQFKLFDRVFFFHFPILLFQQVDLWICDCRLHLTTSVEQLEKKISKQRKTIIYLLFCAPTIDRGSGREREQVSCLLCADFVECQPGIVIECQVLVRRCLLFYSCAFARTNTFRTSHLEINYSGLFSMFMTILRGTRAISIFLE